MLVLNRDEGEKVLLDTSDGRIVVTVVRNARGRLVLGFEAPPSVAIMREEIARNNPATVKVTSGFDAGVAQLEEQRPSKTPVAGSNPAPCTGCQCEPRGDFESPDEHSRTRRGRVPGIG